jgi:hypothetical protein
MGTVVTGRPTFEFAQLGPRPPRRVQVSQPVYERLRATYDFSASFLVDLKGKGSTTAYTLLGRRSADDRAVSGAGSPDIESRPTVAAG